MIARFEHDLDTCFHLFFFLLGKGVAGTKNKTALTSLSRDAKFKMYFIKHVERYQSKTLI